MESLGFLFLPVMVHFFKIQEKPENIKNIFNQSKKGKNYIVNFEVYV